MGNKGCYVINQSSGTHFPSIKFVNRLYKVAYRLPPVTPSSFSLRSDFFFSNELEVCSDEVDVKANFHNLFTNLMDGSGQEGCSRTFSQLNFFAVFFVL